MSDEEYKPRQKPVIDDETVGTEISPVVIGR